MSGKNMVKVFNNSEFGDLRTVWMSGDPWFIATDVCRALEIGNSRQALTRLDDDEKGVISNDTLGGQQKMSVVNEPGLYSLVLVSRKPQARAFKRWITHEVLPAIRKTGGYIAGEESMSDEELLSKALMIANNKIQLRDEQIKNLAETNVQLLPKAEYYDALVERNLLTGIRETAKELKIGERKFVRMLLENGYVFRTANGNLMPYANKNNGLFEVKEGSNSRSGWFGTFMMVTPKGRNKLRLLVTESAA